MKIEATTRARRALSARFQALGPASQWVAPRTGWIRAVRDALGMPASVLAERMGVSEPSVFALERTEQQGTARLDTLSRAAKALDCTLVYALIPNKDLEEQVRERAERIVDDGLRRVQHTMALEHQEAPVAAETREELIERVVHSRGLWRDE